MLVVEVEVRANCRAAEQSRVDQLLESESCCIHSIACSLFSWTVITQTSHIVQRSSSSSSSANGQSFSLTVVQMRGRKVGMLICSLYSRQAIDSIADWLIGWWEMEQDTRIIIVPLQTANYYNLIDTATINRKAKNKNRNLKCHSIRQSIQCTWRTDAHIIIIIIIIIVADCFKKF